MQNEDSLYRPPRGERNKNDDSRQFFLSNCVGGVYHDGLEGGITFNRLADLEPRELPRGEMVASGDEEEAEKKASKEAERKASKDASTADNVSGVRKILHPGDALDSARHTAEMIIKDAMDALQRTKQRLMEILPQSLTPAPPTDKVVEEAELQALAKSELPNQAAGSPSTQESSKVNQKNEKVTEGQSSKEPSSIVTHPALGFLHSIWQPSIQSRL